MGLKSHNWAPLKNGLIEIKSSAIEAIGSDEDRKEV